MRVKLLTSLAGDGFSHQYGDVIEMTDAEAARFIERGMAEPVSGVVEAAAVAKTYETADAAPKKHRKRG